MTSLAPYITKIKSSLLCQSPIFVWLQMGAVGPTSASCSFWVVQVPPSKRSYSSQPSTKDLKKLWCCSRIQSSTHHQGIYLAKIGNIQNMKEENLLTKYISSSFSIFSLKKGNLQWNILFCKMTKICHKRNCLPQLYGNKFERKTLNIAIEKQWDKG